MQIEIKTPDLGEGVEEATVTAVLVRQGQQIQIDQSIVELETEKAVAEVPSPQAGKVVAIHVAQGQTIKPDDLLLTIEAAAEQPAPQAPAPAAEKAQAAPSRPPEQAAPVARAATAEPAPAGRPRETFEQMAHYAHETQGPEPAAEVEEEGATIAQPPRIEPPPPPGGEIPAGPEVRRLAREFGLDLRTIKGTGKNGRLGPEDVLAAARRDVQKAQLAAAEAAPAAAPPSAGQPPPAPPSGAVPPVAPPPAPGAGTDAFGRVRREKVTAVRKAIATQMARSKNSLPHVTNFDDADVTDLEAFRQEQKDALAQQGVKLTLLAFVARAVAEGLRQHTTINAALDLDGGEIVYKQYVNIGIAVDTDRGLVVPVLRDAACLTIAEIARALAELGDKARSGKLALGDMRGGTFTISNLGSVGGTYSTPIINYPESAILLLGRARRLPAVVNDQILPRLMLPLSLSYDHRLIDGAAAARFLNFVKEHLESPTKLLLG